MDQVDAEVTYEEVGCFDDGDPKAMTLATAPDCDVMSAEVRMHKSILSIMSLFTLERKQSQGYYQRVSG